MSGFNLHHRNERSITDVIQGFSGISLAKTGGYGQQAGVMMRGAGGQGLFTLDDIPLLTSIPGLHNLDTLPVEALQSAQIERGPGTISQPLQTLGGSIRLYFQDSQVNAAKRRQLWYFKGNFTRQCGRDTWSDDADLKPGGCF